jgi:sulfate transporter 4
MGDETTASQNSSSGAESTRSQNDDGINTSNANANNNNASSSGSSSSAPPPSSSLASASDGVRNRNYSKHRQTRDRIQQDSATSHRHYVPEHTNHNQEQAHSTTSSSFRIKNPKAHKWVEKHTNSMYDTMKNRSCDEWTQIILPMYSWLKTYNWRTNLLQDVVAGLTVGVMVLPQSMSYAELAGLPVEYGLYSALVPVYAYSMFGSSRQLAVGPVALISLLVATGLQLVLDQQDITPENTENYMELYTTLAVQTSFLVGVTYIIMGLLRLGFVTIFLSHAVISGFTTGAAVIIGLSQLKYFLGYDVKKSDRFHIMIQRIFADIDQFNYKTFLVGIFSTFALLLMKHLGKTYPKLKWLRAAGPLVVTVLGIILQVAADVEDRGIPVVGKIPQGLPSVTADILFPIGNFSTVFIVVISIVIVGFMESIAIAKQLANKHNYELDSSLELVGLGMANIGAGLFQGYPVTGSFSRSAVNNESGATSGISGAVTATLVGLALLLLTPVFELLVSLHCSCGLYSVSYGLSCLSCQHLSTTLNTMC